jgi:hypothetical protein
MAGLAPSSKNTESPVAIAFMPALKEDPIDAPRDFRPDMTDAILCIGPPSKNSSEL